MGRADDVRQPRALQEHCCAGASLPIGASKERGTSKESTSVECIREQDSSVVLADVPPWLMGGRAGRLNGRHLHEPLVEAKQDRGKYLGGARLTSLDPEARTGFGPPERHQPNPSWPPSTRAVRRSGRPVRSCDVCPERRTESQMLSSLHATPQSARGHHRPDGG